MGLPVSLRVASPLRGLAACALACMLALSGCAQAPSAPSAEKSQGAYAEAGSWSPRAGEPARLDDDGYLYYLDYAKDYYSEEVLRKLDESGATRPSCSAFFTHTLEGEPLTCRNFDEPHRVSAEDRTITGLNVVLHCAPAGKYESIGAADAVYCDTKNPLLKRGGPDVEGFSADLLDTIPYQCMDAMNERGLAVSVLMVDIREGEEGARMAAGSSIMLRRLVDNCADVAEAIDYARTSDLTPADWQSCHLFVTDAAGRSVVLESRNGELSTVETDVVTNFYVGSDDIADSYYKGRLREEAVRLVDEGGAQRYRFGYGHGYHRFVTLASQLEMHRDTTSETYRTRMSEAEALVMLQSVAQNERTEAVGTSFTQFSSMYRNAARTLEVWSFQQWQTSYAFDVHGERIQNERGDSS
ncbi:carcinine hydrolase/isopenicillin-N N-acyltransferase family protein [Olsenella intestinalis]|uniref:carcinine hydrolase/isopenicillin-N N-acyltransferase family protein n=1 Tax=Olsenella intestinalis TaxID=2930083 RepID=UPI00200DFB72|nr:carcinine hydrolase/isopenicillin-N N-acyltransferase family protein [Olsenella intestinalis]